MLSTEGELCVHLHAIITLPVEQNNTTTPTLHLFNGRFSKTTWVSRYQKGKTSLDLNEARDVGVLGRQ